MLIPSGAVFVLSHSIRSHPSSFFRCLNRCFSAQPSYWHCIGDEHLSPLTIGQLVQDAAERWGDREALVSVYQKQRLTFNEVNEKVKNLAASFLDLGLKRGDRLGIWGPDSIEWYLSNMAACQAGLFAVSINPAYQKPELQYCLKKVGIKALITAESFKTQNYVEMIQGIAPEITSSSPGMLKSKSVPELSTVIVMSTQNIPGFYRYIDIVEKATNSSLNEINQLQNDIQPDEGCYIQFTSGTTGQPKAAVLTHHNVVNNAYFVAKRMNLWEKHHRICINVPFFHVYGNVMGLLSGLFTGSTLVLPAPRFDPVAAIQSIKEEKCTITYGTPTMYVDMISKLEESKTVLPPLDLVVSGGAICPEILQKRIMNTFKTKRILSPYGMTETSPCTFIAGPDDSLETCSKTVGKILEHTEAKVVDKEGKIVPMGQPGELLIRGYVTMLGYWEDEQKTKDIYAPGRWLRTGDQFVILDGGYGQIVGRLKEMIIRGGENLFPKEIEEFLQTHPKIIEVHVFGVPDERMGEEMCASIRLSSGSSLSSDDVKSYCKGKIAHFKIPKYIWFVNEFPKTTSGKIQKFKLQEMFQKEKGVAAIK